MSDNPFLATPPTREAVTIPEGAIFTITAGAYSDFRVEGVFRALKPIPELHARATFSAAGSIEKALATMAREGLMEPVHSFELWLDENTWSDEDPVAVITESP